MTDLKRTLLYVRPDPILCRPPDPDLAPSNILHGIENYLYGIQPGDFLCAVIANDLGEAVRRAHPESRQFLHHIVAATTTLLPSKLRGSYRALDRHLKETKRQYEKSDSEA